MRVALAWSVAVLVHALLAGCGRSAAPPAVRASTPAAVRAPTPAAAPADTADTSEDPLARVIWDSTSKPDKRRTFEALLARESVLVHLDARRPGVEVPSQHRADPNLVLRFGHHLTPPIPDLAVDDRGVSGTLSFGGQPYRCVVPWSAVFGMAEGERRGTMWSEDVPPDVNSGETSGQKPPSK